MECSCKVCQAACRKRPGWFLPADLEPAAKAMGLTLEEFFQNYLVVDFYVGQGTMDFTFVIGPAMGEAKPGRVAPFSPFGRCVFFDPDGACVIHAGKPFECSRYDHTRNNEDNQEVRMVVVREWGKPENQALIRRLLGGEPIPPLPSFLDILELEMLR